MSQGYLFAVGICLTLIVYVVQELSVFKNRWFLISVLLIALGVLNFSIWQYRPALWAWFVGVTVSISSIILLLRATRVAFPHFGTLQVGHKVITWSSRILFSIVVTLMLFAIFWDTAHPIFPSIAWRAIASLWAFLAVILYLDYMRRQKTHKLANQFSENAIKYIRAVAEQLWKLNAGSYSRSIISALREIRQDKVFNDWCSDKASIKQQLELYEGRLNELFDKIVKLKDKTEKINVDDIPVILNDIRSLILDYRNAVQSFIKMLIIFGNEGSPKVWEDGAVLSKIVDLREEYDNLMSTVRDLLIYIPGQLRSHLPSEDQLTKFDRMEGFSIKVMFGKSTLS
jgi:hypothetical protein